MPITIPIIEGEVYCDGLICCSAIKNMEQRERCVNRNTRYLCLAKFRDVYRDEITAELKPGLEVTMRRRIKAINSKGIFEVHMSYSVIKDKGAGLFSGSISSWMDRADTLEEAIELVDIMTAKTEARAIKH